MSLVDQQRPSEECPRRVRLYLDEPTSIAAIFTAGQCQKATYAAQQRLSLIITSSARASCVGGISMPFLTVCTHSLDD
jgi:hypothetical protein